MPIGSVVELHNEQVLGTNQDFIYGRIGGTDGNI